MIYNRQDYMPVSFYNRGTSTDRQMDGCRSQKKSWDIDTQMVQSENAVICQAASCRPVSFTQGEVLFMNARVVYALQNNSLSGSK